MPLSPRGKNKMFDVITVGSATVDVFISSKSRSVDLLWKGKKEEVCFPVGAKILIDYLHMDTGGGGTNTAVAFSRLGLKTGWVGKIGTDINSSIVLEQMKKEKVKFLGKVQQGGSTGFSVIIIGIEKDRTILAYKGINDTLKKSDVNFNKLKTKWIYMGSMMGDSLKTAGQIADYAKKKKIKIAFNPSLYLAKLGLKQLNKIISACNLLVLNMEEAKAITRSSKPVDDLLKQLQQKIPLVIITNGKKGAYAYNGINKYTLRIGKQKVVETTGAGDSFASGILAGISMGFDIEKSLRLGYAESVSVLGYIGAKEQLLSRTQALKAMKSKKLCKITKKKI
ncbi:carbohydrate kinase family protein [Candidatus Woesearchaeota archaeon]|nr:carbohydrate kinase family protein [Candidatus Woesearchaeota archaeon]MBW3005798.1 carbohydrate kinase family protein [Candidatus Woesearchaeota archaeon]